MVYFENPVFGYFLIFGYFEGSSFHLSKYVSLNHIIFVVFLFLFCGDEGVWGLSCKDKLFR